MNAMLALYIILLIIGIGILIWMNSESGKKWMDKQ